MNGCVVYMVCVYNKLCFFIVIFEMVICDFIFCNSFSNAEISLHNIQCFRIVFISEITSYTKSSPKYMGGKRRKCRWGWHGGVTLVKTLSIGAYMVWRDVPAHYVCFLALQSWVRISKFSPLMSVCFCIHHTFNPSMPKSSYTPTCTLNLIQIHTVLTL